MDEHIVVVLLIAMNSVEVTVCSIDPVLAAGAPVDCSRIGHRGRVTMDIEGHRRIDMAQE
jgi:hypothetical protein